MKRLLCWFGHHHVVYRVTTGGVRFPTGRCTRCGERFL